MELKVTLNCGIPVDFTGKLDEPYNFIGTFSDMLAKYRTSEYYEIKNSAMIEIELRATKYAHKALSGYIKRVAMANEAVRLLMSQLYNITNQNKQLCKKMRFYDDVKAKHPGVMIIFRCGDFYETYCDDAVEASRILGITLTVHSERTESNGQKLRIAIFPEHALTAYLPKLLRSGKRVAICCERESALGNDKKAENNSN